MINLTKKHLLNAVNDYPSNGNFVHWFIKEQKITKTAVAQHLRIAPRTLSQYFKQQSLQFGILWRISQAINYNLLMDLGQRLNIPFETKAEKALKETLAEKEELIKELQLHVKLLKEMGK